MKKIMFLALALLLAGCGRSNQKATISDDSLLHSAVQIYPESDGTFTVEVIASRRPWVPVVTAWHTSRSNAQATYSAITNQATGTPWLKN